MRHLLAIVLIISSRAVADDLRIPIQVDQSGKSIYFVTNEASDVELEAARFCRAHLSGMDEHECTQQLVTQASTLRGVREEAQQSLPGLSFTVRNPKGQELTFVHEQGANPADEAAAFCSEHFRGVPTPQCVEAMLKNAQMALQEATGGAQ